jgi:hypothetical protein
VELKSLSLIQNHVPEYFTVVAASGGSAFSKWTKMMGVNPNCDGDNDTIVRPAATSSDGTSISALTCEGNRDDRPGEDRDLVGDTTLRR